MIEDRVGIWKKKCMTAQKSGEQRWTGTGDLTGGWIMDGWVGGRWWGRRLGWGLWDVDGWMNGVAEQMEAVIG